MMGLVLRVVLVIDLWIRDSSYVSRSLWSVIDLSRFDLGLNTYRMMVTGDSVACLFLGIFLVIFLEIVLAICWC